MTTSGNETLVNASMKLVTTLEIVSSVATITFTFTKGLIITRQTHEILDKTKKCYNLLTTGQGYWTMHCHIRHMSGFERAYHAGGIFFFTAVDVVNFPPWWPDSDSPQEPNYPPYIGAREIEWDESGDTE